jgi:hypothetical protein
MLGGTGSKATHPVYSDFSHMASSGQVDLGGLTFAVGLREDNPDEMVAKILPLTRIVPGEVKPRTIKKVPKKVAEDKPCERPDCMARKERYLELNSENEHLRQQLKALEGRVSASKNKISLTERSIQIAEDKNDNLKGQIDDVQARIFTVEADVEKGDQLNQELRNQLAELMFELDRLKKDTHADNDKLAVVMQNLSGPSVVFSKSSNSKTPQAKEVSMLKYDGDDSDDD